MIRTLLVLPIIGLSVLVPDSQHQKTSATEHGIAGQCPRISVECPTELREISFSARVEGKDANVNLRYQWCITRGEIISGQGTAKIIVKTERDGSSLSASVEVLGLPAECGNTASCSISHF